MKITTKKLFPALVILVLIGFGIAYQNCGQVDPVQENTSATPSNSQDQSVVEKSDTRSKANQDQLEVVLADGTKIYMVRKEKRDPLIVTLTDGTKLYLVPSD